MNFGMLCLSLRQVLYMYKGRVSPAFTFMAVIVRVGGRGCHGDQSVAIHEVTEVIVAHVPQHFNDI